MPRARSTRMYRQTAATQIYDGSGCLSGFIIVPLSVILISAFLASIAWKTNPPTPLPLTTNTTNNVATTNLITIDVTPAPTLTLTSTSTGISPIFRIEVQYWADSIVNWSAAAGVDPNLAATIMQIESCGDPQATSSAGAMGLFQVMPFHFTKSDSPYQPDTNALRGLNYLVRSLATANGNARLALAGYNGGIGVINRGEWTWPAQTKRYVQYGAPIYQDAISGYQTSTALEEWYSKYGASLCRQAHQRLGLP